MNKLYFGDCLDIIKEFAGGGYGSQGADLIYLDPPFNSKADYNILYDNPTGDKSRSQIEAFEDTWHWGDQSEREFSDILKQSNISPAPRGESLGYPTQKPLALLERIINASSNPGDVILDPFCGCGTAVHAAQKLNRRWIGKRILYLSAQQYPKVVNYIIFFILLEAIQEFVIAWLLSYNRVPPNMSIGGISPMQHKTGRFPLGNIKNATIYLLE